ncbi:MAG: 3-deoxy-7-phosphoheptulonate synthase [Clostridia bacterium]|nr:3-deoxy-7-phosphoheptulonate synthase [Clostridia bacterium]
MIITIKNGADEKQLNKLVDWIARQGASADVETAGGKLLVGILSGVENIDEELLKSMDIVEKVTRVTEKYKLTNRKFHPEDTVVTAGGKKIGGENYTFIAGPCSVESEKQIIGIAKAVKKAGAAILRGGAFKPRTSPYDFQGLKSEGIKLLKKAKAETGMPIITEIAGVKNIDDFDGVDIIQIGARNMQNFELLKEVGRLDTPVLLKRGLVNTIDELLLSAEYVMSEGNKNVILCERGIRTFETLTRNTLDLGVIPLLKEFTHLPVIVDPSHASGLKRLVSPLSLASAAVSADGVMIEVHNDPEHALCDGAQAVKPEEFAEIVKKTEGILSICGNKRVER